MNLNLPKKKENLFYLLIFGVLFLAPVISLYVRSTGEEKLPFFWSDIFDVWKIFAGYLAIFLIHNYFIAPLLIYKKKKGIYFLSVMVLLSVFIMIQCANRPSFGPPPHKPEQLTTTQLHQQKSCQTAEKENQKEHKKPHKRRHGPPLIFGEADLISGVILFFMLGMNLAVKLYFKNEEDNKQMTKMEKENLEHQLEYLKFQINPHFFMNTLNNIHALVDIAPEQAKSSIVVLSKMMRYILYEGNKKTIPLEREIECINNYVSLMKMRYTEKVQIELEEPARTGLQSTGDEVPPLLFITFVENAFKHGVSYLHDSYIHIRIAIEEQHIVFECANSMAEHPYQEKGGIGLDNVKKRLSLLYGCQHQLSINQTATDFFVRLQLPRTDKQN